MTNRVNLPQDDDVQKAIEAIKNASMKIYNLIDPGMSIVVSVPEDDAIIVPGQARKMRTLIISKPGIVLTIAPKGVI